MVAAQSQRLTQQDFKNAGVITLIALFSILLIVGSIWAMQQFLKVAMLVTADIDVIPGQEFIINMFHDLPGQPLFAWASVVIAYLVLFGSNENKRIGWIALIAAVLLLRIPALIVTNITTTGTLLGFSAWATCNFIQVWPFIARVFYGRYVQFWSAAVITSYVLEFCLNYMRFPWYPWDMFWLHWVTGAWSHTYFNFWNIAFTGLIGVFEFFFRGAVTAVLSTARSTKNQRSKIKTEPAYVEQTTYEQRANNVMM